MNGVVGLVAVITYALRIKLNGQVLINSKLNRELTIQKFFTLSTSYKLST